MTLLLAILAALPAAAAADAQPRFPDAAYIDDKVRPTGFMGGAGLSKRLQISRSFVVEWDAVDRGGHVASMHVRVRSAAHNGAFGSWRTWLRTPDRVSKRFHGASGRTYCFAVRAIDWVGNVGAWSRERCTATPLPATRLLARSGQFWRSESGSPDLGRARVSVRMGALISSGPIRANRVALIATRCPGCGSVEVRGMSGVMRTISLEAKTERRGQLVPIATFAGVRAGALELRVIGPAPVRIEGLVVTRATDPR